MTETEALADVIALAVHSATAPLLAKIAVLEARPYVSQDLLDTLKENAADLRTRMITVEARAPIPGPPGPQGEKGTDGIDGKDGARGLDGKDGAAGVNGKDGASGLNGADGVNGKDGAPGLNGKDGADGLAGKDGKDGLHGKDGADGLHGKDGANGADGKDGIGVMDAMLDRAGQLILTMSNGQTKMIGVVVGQDGTNGSDGQPGRDVDPLFVQDFLSKELAKWPKPQDGRAGKDGTPGLSPDDFDWDFNPETRAFTIKFLRGGVVLSERTKTLTGMRIYRGVFNQGKTYEQGDVVSWDGSEWTALDQTKVRPGAGDTAWKMTVKHGDKGGRGPEGKPGRDGRDLTQMDGQGRKW